ncbi:MAG TPA: tetratricopeptide repeat protein [Streptosporangiaceae bacterium]|nr:tetratricopeptide repeat protein [Streptosporangiaceae bacterium]
MTEHPYIGPRPFSRADADRYFGRAEQAREVRSQWLSQRVTVVYGPAGVGKTSLLHAGVIPLLEGQETIDLLPVGRFIHWTARSMVADLSTNIFRHALLHSWETKDHPANPGQSIVDYLTARTRIEKRRRAAPILAAIDQFEDLFGALPTRRAQREQLIADLADALRELPVHLLLNVREDQLSTLRSEAERLRLPPLAPVRLRELDPGQALEAVTRPLEGTGRRFAPKAAELLIERIRTVTYTDRFGASATIRAERVEPLALQTTCAALWDSLPSDRHVITAADLEALGEPEDMLADRFDAVVREVCTESGTKEEPVRAWVEATFITEHGTRGAAYRGVTRTGGMPNTVVDGFADRHFLTVEQRAGTAWYQLGHDHLVGAVRRSNRRRNVVPRTVQLPARGLDFRLAAETALAEGDFVAARRLADAAAQRYAEQGDDRQFARTLALQGEIARMAGDLQSAHRSFGRARSEFESQQDRSSAVRMLKFLADLCVSMENYDEAVDLQRQAISRMPADLEARTGLAYALWHRGSPADAEAAFNDALDLDRSAARAVAGRGLVRIALADYARALDDLEHALSLELPASDEEAVRSARTEALRALGRQRAQGPLTVPL